MKTLLKVGRKFLTCAAFIIVAVLIAVVLKYNKKPDPYEVFLLKAEIEGSKILIEENDRKVSEDVFLKDCKVDSIRNLQGNQEVLKIEAEKLQSNIGDYQNAIIFYKKIIEKNTAKLVKKK